MSRRELYYNLSQGVAPPLAVLQNNAEFYSAGRFYGPFSSNIVDLPTFKNFADNNKPDAKATNSSQRPSWRKDMVNGYPTVFGDINDLDFYDFQDSYESLWQGNFAFVFVAAIDKPNNTSFLFGTQDGSGQNRVYIRVETNGIIRIVIKYNGGNRHFMSIGQDVCDGIYRIISFEVDFPNNNFKWKINGNTVQDVNTTLPDPATYSNTVYPYLYARHRGGEASGNGHIEANIAEFAFGNLTSNQIDKAHKQLNQIYQIY